MIGKGGAILSHLNSGKKYMYLIGKPICLSYFDSDVLKSGIKVIISGTLRVSNRQKKNLKMKQSGQTLVSLAPLSIIHRQHRTLESWVV